MFDTSHIDSLAETVADVKSMRFELATSGQLGEALRAVQAAQDVLDGVAADLLARFEDVEGFLDDGAPSARVWARRHLRLDSADSGARIKAGRTLRQLDGVRASLADGRIRLAHVREFGAGVTKAGRDVIDDAQPWLLEVAEACEPAELRSTIRELVDVVHPDRLDEAWVRGMDKNDLRVSRVGDGFAVDGFLDIVRGARFKTWLDAAAAPRDADDDRVPSDRRIEALDDLVSSALDHGLPSDRGGRPQMHVLIEVETLRDDAGAAPATLTGFGSIGRDLLDYLTCVSDVTPLLVDGSTAGGTPQARILNVGRTHRLATERQRTAVRARQGGTCASPGCTNSHLEVHHVQWWERDGGPTDIDNLVGLCTRCHHLVHAGRLRVEKDGDGGFSFAHPTARVIPDHRRESIHAFRRRLRHLRHGVAAGRGRGTRGGAGTDAEESAWTARCHIESTTAPPQRVAGAGSTSEVLFAASILHARHRPPPRRRRRHDKQ